MKRIIILIVLCILLLLTGCEGSEFDERKHRGYCAECQYSCRDIPPIQAECTVIEPVKCRTVS